MPVLNGIGYAGGFGKVVQELATNAGQEREPTLVVEQHSADRFDVVIVNLAEERVVDEPGEDPSTGPQKRVSYLQHRVVPNTRTARSCSQSVRARSHSRTTRANDGTLSQTQNDDTGSIATDQIPGAIRVIARGWRDDHTEYRMTPIERIAGVRVANGTGDLCGEADGRVKNSPGGLRSERWSGPHRWHLAPLAAPCRVAPNRWENRATGSLRFGYVPAALRDGGPGRNG
jgi:hypothetical protein